MRFRFVGAVVPVLLLTMLCAQAASADGESLSDEDRIWGLMQVWAEARFNFPFFDQVPSLDWDASVQRSI